MKQLNQPVYQTINQEVDKQTKIQTNSKPYLLLHTNSLLKYNLVTHSVDEKPKFFI